MEIGLSCNVALPDINCVCCVMPTKVIRFVNHAIVYKCCQVHMLTFRKVITACLLMPYNLPIYLVTMFIVAYLLLFNDNRISSSFTVSQCFTG